MNYTTTLTGLQFFGYHGVYPQEQVLGAVFEVDIQVTRVLNTPISQLDEATNYEILYNLAKQTMAEREELIEVVAQKLLSRILSIFNQSRVEVTIHKPNPAGLFKSGKASVTIIHQV